jgi:hypothetical protein
MASDGTVRLAATVSGGLAAEISVRLLVSAGLLATFPEFEVDLLRMRSRERIPIARSHGAQGPQADPAANTVRFQTHD